MLLRSYRADRRRSWVVRSWTVVLMLGVLLTAMFVGSCARSDGAQGDGFVYRNGTQLMLNDAPYRFVGVNNYDLTGCHTGNPVSEADADKFFSQLSPNSMTRVWAFEPWGVEGVERTVRLAEKYGQKLILTLADGGGNCSEPVYDAAWFEQGFRGSYFAWVARLATAFKGSPAVGIWELMNEPGSKVNNMTPGVIKQFYDATAAHIKQIESRHLVSTGALAPWESFQNGVSGYAEAHSGPDIDVVSVHEFDFAHANAQTIVSPHFHTALDAARTIGKPVYVGETGVTLGNGCMSANERAEYSVKSSTSTWPPAPREFCIGLSWDRRTTLALYATRNSAIGTRCWVGRS